MSPGRTRKERYELTEPIEGLLARLRAVHAGDKAAEREASGHGWRAVLAAIAAALATFGIGPFGWPAAIAAAACAAAAIASLVLHRLAKRFDIDDRKVATVLQFLKIVAADTPPAAPLRVQVDFRPYEDGGTRQSAEKQGGFFSPAPTVRVYKYEHNWLTIGGRLADGNAYLLRVVDRVTRKEKPKRKYTKVRESIRGSVELALRLRPRYGDPEAVLARLKRARAPEPLRVVRVRLAGRSLRAELAKPAALRVSARHGASEPAADAFVDGHSLLAALLWAYAAVGGQDGARAAG